MTDVHHCESLKPESSASLNCSVKLLEDSQAPNVLKRSDKSESTFSVDKWLDLTLNNMGIHFSGQAMRDHVGDLEWGKNGLTFRPPTPAPSSDR